MGDGLRLYFWWDEPAYRAAQGTFSERGAFILGKLHDYDAAKLKDVLADVYRNGTPDLTGITRFEWGTIVLKDPGAGHALTTGPCSIIGSVPRRG